MAARPHPASFRFRRRQRVKYVGALRRPENVPTARRGANLRRAVGPCTRFFSRPLLAR